MTLDWDDSDDAPQPVLSRARPWSLASLALAAASLVAFSTAVIARQIVGGTNPFSVVAGVVVSPLLALAALVVSVAALVRHEKGGAFIALVCAVFALAPGVVSGLML